MTGYSSSKGWGVSKCEIDVEIGRVNDRFVAGDDVEGLVRIRANQDFESNGLDVSLTWFTHGKGNTALDHVGVSNHPTTPWRAGEVRHDVQHIYLNSQCTVLASLRMGHEYVANAGNRR